MNKLLLAPLLRRVTLFLFTLTVSVICLAQDRPYVDHTRAVDDASSRAEEEAERLVSLPAEKIISILEQEPGLFLQVKKKLVRTAYEQGRLLDPQDLNDDATFRLIRTDENIRVLVTREIEDRGYITVKPSREELREWQQRQSLAIAANRVSTAGTAPQEPESQTEQLPSGGDSDRRKQPAPSPQNPSPEDLRRQVLQAQAESGNAGSLNEGLPLDALAMPQISPDQLSGLLSTKFSGASALAGATGSSGYKTGLALSSGLAFPGGGLGLTSGIDSYADSTTAPQPEQRKSSEPPPQTSARPAGTFRSDQPTLGQQANPYADVPSLYDLYAQYSRRTPVLERFGADVFRNGTGNLSELPMDLPVGPDYVLGPGDGLRIDLWGSVSQRLQRQVDRQGTITLPEVGGVQVAGRTLGEVQHLVQTALRTQFRTVDADVSLSGLRTIRVYVVGDVRRPGAYDVSSLSTPLNALYQGGGPTSRGSMRLLKHFRGDTLVENVDLYDLLLHGVHSGLERLQSGDTILVPPITGEVTIEGMVRRPAIYELNGENSLAQVLQLGGGVLPSGTLRHVDVERVVAHQSRTMLGIDLPEDNKQGSVTAALESFAIQDGDKIKISPILPFANQTIYLVGHVFRPGKYAYRDGMKVSDLIKSYDDLMPEPYKQHAEIIRLKAPDFTPEILAFNLGDALEGKDQDLGLKPFDTVRVFGRYDFEDSPIITVTGAVRDPGDHLTNGATYLRDAVYLAGNTTADAQLDDAQVFRRTENGKLKVLSVNLSQALAGDPANNILLQPKDRVFIHKNLLRTDPPIVTVKGEVERPGKYPLGENMSAAGLVRLAGGVKRSAYTESADLTRYMVEQGNKLVSEHVEVQIAKAMSGEPDSDVRLHDGDVLTIGRLTGWNDIGATVTISGEVAHPASYGIQEGERLSSVLARAGGFTANAYPYGAIFERAQVLELEQKNRAQLISQVQEEGSTLKLIPDDPVSKDASLHQWKAALQKLVETPPAGRVVIHVSKDVSRWKNTSADIQVRAGDILYIPKIPNFVTVDGAVYNPTAISYKPGKSAGWYLRQAGGPTNVADKKAIFVVRADGSVVGGKGGLFNGGAEQAELRPGDMVVVPDKAFGGGFKWRETLQIAQLVSAVGIAVQVARSF